ncbi:MAG: alpha/beta hydrolase [Candidatus Omnitrophica bacterium]|nr:alpha/beta hydrolase [Candidatus Omnitrophota bacterium]
MIKYMGHNFWIVILVAFLVLFFSVRKFEQKSMFFPKKGFDPDMPAPSFKYEDVYLTTGDGVRLNGWYISSPGAKDTILFFHGNAGNISNRIPKLTALSAMGVNVFIVDYRGYGYSGGVPGEKGFYLDAEAAYKYLIDVKKSTGMEIILLGGSIGAAVAVELASKKEVKALIADGAFSSVKDMAAMYYPVIPPVVISAKFDSISKIKDISCPKLFMHSADDEVVPISMGEKLYAAAKPPKFFAKTHGYHNDISWDGGREFSRVIKSFIDSL